VSDLLGQVRAQEAAVGTLRRGLANGRVHHALLFDGPPGVGKELAAFGLAQALVCERREPGVDRACGACSACKRALPPKDPSGLPLHPDVVLLERGLHEPARIGRRTPETQDISIDQIRALVLARAAFGPHEGRAKVFVVRRAEELSTSAANALLKTLEEPGDRTHFVLLTQNRDWLMPTILSRTQRVRFGHLPDDVVLALLRERGVSAEDAAQAARLAAGSFEAALELVDQGALADKQAFVDAALAALDDKSSLSLVELAEQEKKDARGRGALAEKLGALAAALHARATKAVVEGRASARDVEVLTRQHALVLDAIVRLDGNASPQLVVESTWIAMRAL